jgi:hypothetical protein
MALFSLRRKVFICLSYVAIRIYMWKHVEANFVRYAAFIVPAGCVKFLPETQNSA